MNGLVLKSITLIGNSSDLNLFLVLIPYKYYWDLICKSIDYLQILNLNWFRKYVVYLLLIWLNVKYSLHFGFNITSLESVTLRYHGSFSLRYLFICQRKLELSSSTKEEVFLVLAALSCFIFCYPRSKPSKINVERWQVSWPFKSVAKIIFFSWTLYFHKCELFMKCQFG